MNPFIVSSAIQLTPYILQLFLEPRGVFSYQAGDYVMLGFEQGETRPFSIANAPSADGLIELHIRKQDSEWMDRLFQVKVGETLWIDGPKPQMKLQHEAELNLFIAGGTGISPIKALLEQRLKNGISQPTYLYWGVRHPEERYIDQMLKTLADNQPMLHYVSVISEPEPTWQGPSGLVHQYALKQHSDLNQAMVYLCGAWPMVQTAKADFTEAGLSNLAFIH